MNLKIILLSVLIANISLFATEMGEKENYYGKQKAVYDINYSGGENNKEFFKVLRNVKNHIKAVGEENIELTVVLTGDALDMLADANSNIQLQSQIEELKMQNVKFLVCNNTLVGRNIDYKTLFDVSKDDIVPSANAELSHLQSQGFSYHKP